VISPRLSVCIPTYNFGRFIGETLEALRAQAVPGVEVVVLDSGSTDDTAAVVAGVAARFPALRYHRTERPCGIDRDLAATVALARGDHCWLLSSDDVPAPGALAAVLAALHDDPEVLLLDRIECDVALRPLRSAPWLGPGLVGGDFRLGDPADLARYLGLARSIGALFSYMSSLVVRRTAWEAHPAPDHLVGTHYAHVARLFLALRTGRLRYLAGPQVLCRGENDSFARGGVVKRFRIDLDGYLQLCEALFPAPGDRTAFLAVMRREHPWWIYLEVRSRAGSAEAWQALRLLLLAFGYAPWQVAVISAVGAAPPVMALARAAWFGARRLRRLLRP